MSDDYIEKMAKDNLIWRGEEVTPEKAIEEFPLYGRERRASELLRIDNAMNEAGDIGLGSLHKHAKQLALRRELGEIHRRLIEVDR